MFELENVHVIGAGGTGSFLLSHLARIIKGYNLKHSVYVWDGDVVDNERNILRSPIYCGADTGKFKTDVVCSRLNLLYGLDSFASRPYFLLQDENDELPQEIYCANQAIITCVDSMKFRQILALKFQDAYKGTNDYDDLNSPLFWMDCGNDRDFGQVYIGWNHQTAPYAQWPNFFRQKQGKKNASCSNNSFSQQGAMINDMAAVAACLLLEPVLKGRFPDNVACYFGKWGMRMIKRE